MGLVCGRANSKLQKLSLLAEMKNKLPYVSFHFKVFSIIDSSHEMPSLVFSEKKEDISKCLLLYQHSKG